MERSRAILRSWQAHSRTSSCRIPPTARSGTNASIGTNQRITNDTHYGSYRPRAHSPNRRLNHGPLGTRNKSTTAAPKSAPVPLTIDGADHAVSALLLRDLDESARTLDPSTRQKLFATSDLPTGIRAQRVERGSRGVAVDWDGDLETTTDTATSPVGPTFVAWDALRALATTGVTDAATSVLAAARPARTLWDAAALDAGTREVAFEAYMRDEATLLAALRQLHTHGLVWVRDVPGEAGAVAALAERVGPLKNTFYGATWDVRSVPEAKNVAYTAQDLGFHMDLLYMRQPPHLQLLHCIRSSAVGGASLFVDSYRAAVDLYASSPAAFAALAELDVNFHYNHPTSHLYRQARQVFEFHPLSVDGVRLRSPSEILAFFESGDVKGVALEDLLDAVSWSPPFQAPFALNTIWTSQWNKSGPPKSPLEMLSQRVDKWHEAAREFSGLIHRPEAISERTMRPGDCVIFDNRRVLHARRAFEVGDLGAERWLRGAYLDKDPYLSKMAVLQNRFGKAKNMVQQP